MDKLRGGEDGGRRASDNRLLLACRSGALRPGCAPDRSAEGGPYVGTGVVGVSLAGYTGADGLRHALGADSPFGDAVNTMQAIQYLEFGSKM